MNRGLFGAQLNNCWEIISYLELDYERVWYPTYEQYNPTNFKGLTYLEVWKKCLADHIYNFQLADNSLIQFRVDSFNPLKVGYSYYECPYLCLSYAEFVESELGFDIKGVRDGFMKELLVIRQIYPYHWVVLVEHRKATIWCRNIRTNLNDVHTDYWNPKDLLELFLQ